MRSSIRKCEIQKLGTLLCSLARLVAPNLNAQTCTVQAGPAVPDTTFDQDFT